MSAWTDAQIESGIVVALEEGDARAAVSLLECLAAQNLTRATEVYNVMQAGITYSQVADVLKAAGVRGGQPQP